MYKHLNRTQILASVMAVGMYLHPEPGVSGTGTAAPTKEELAAQKKAQAEALKLQKEQAKVAEAARKQAEKDAAKAAKEAEKEAKEKAKADAKAAKEAAKKANEQPEQNGVRRPKPETLCGQAWAVFDELSQKLGAPCAIADALKAAGERGLNEGNVKAEYSRWRKFFGVTGRVVSPSVAEEKAAKEAKAAEEKAAKEAEKKAAAAKKEQEKADKKAAAEKEKAAKLAAKEAEKARAAEEKQRKALEAAAAKQQSQGAAA